MLKRLFQRFRKPKYEPAWYESKQYINIPRGVEPTVTWHIDAMEDVIVKMDTTNNIITIYTNKGTYLNQELMRINL